MKFLFSTIFLLIFLCQLNAQKTSDTLSKKETDNLIAGYCSVLRQTYFNKVLGEEIASTLEKKLQAGEFYHVTHLTDRLSLFLREVTKDNHFYIGMNRPSEATNAVQTTTHETANKNGGFSEVKIIDNRIGYIKWTEFIADDESFQKLVAALQFLKGCKYLVFDLSNCPGGDGRIGGFVNRHLFEDNDYQNLLRKKCSNEGEWHQSEVPYNYSNGPTFYNVPVFVIVSKQTASAAEYFALTIKNMKRGTVLGDTTAGAGNPVTMVTFGNYFAYIPICEIVTKDGESIEGKGVTPNVILKGNDWVQETVEYIRNHN